MWWQSTFALFFSIIHRNPYFLYSQIYTCMRKTDVKIGFSGQKNMNNNHTHQLCISIFSCNAVFSTLLLTGGLYDPSWFFQYHSQTILWLLVSSLQTDFENNFRSLKLLLLMMTSSRKMAVQILWSHFFESDKTCQWNLI